MPQCSDYGSGWAGEYPNCTYQTPGFTGSVESLGYGGRLPTDIEGRPYEEYFDKYDPTQQEMAEIAAGTKASAATSVWDLQQQQLGKAWGLKKGELGWGAGMGFKEARRAGIGAKRKSGMYRSGTAEEMQRTAEANVMTRYRGGIKAGETAYQQTLETGALGLEQETTNIFQQLGQDVFGFQEDWRGGQRQTYLSMLGLGLEWGDGSGDVDPASCKDDCGSAATQCFETTQQIYWSNCETAHENCISGCGG